MAAKINLLDWRAERRVIRQNQFVTMVVAALGIAAGGVAAVSYGYSNAIDFQQARNNFLKGQIAEMEKKIKEIEDLERTRANLIGRMKVIEELQSSRAAMVHFFDEIVNTLPDGVYIKSLSQRGGKVTVDGIAESNGRVSTYMKNIDASSWFADPKLVIIRTNDAQAARRQSDFQLQFNNLTKRKPPGEEGVEEEVLE